MNILQIIAERKISQAIAEGGLQVEGWKNRPLPEDQDPLMADELKMAYKILKNAGYLPPEIEVRKEIQQLEELLIATEDEQQRLRQMKKLDVLLLKLEQVRGRQGNIADQDDYYHRVVARVSLNSKKV